LKHYRYCSAKKEFELTNGIQYDSSDHIDDDIDIVIPTEKKRVGKTKK
jgi:hypothetical protein